VTERVIIVGGTSGIGLATAHRLIGEGKQVIVTGRDPERLAKALPNWAIKRPARTVDASDPAATKAFFAGLGPIDHVVVAASGASGAGPFRTLAVDALAQGDRRQAVGTRGHRSSSAGNSAQGRLGDPAQRRLGGRRDAWYGRSRATNAAVEAMIR